MNMSNSVAYIDDVKKNTVAYLSDVEEGLDVVSKELIPLLNTIKENQIRLIALLTPTFGKSDVKDIM